MRVLVFGAGGQLGGELVRAGAAGGDEVVGLFHADVDVTDGDAVRRALQAHGPGLVFNAVAYTAVDRAESEPELAMRVNGTAPGLLAKASAEAGATLVHFSTDYVFDGSATAPIAEDTRPAPLGAYGRSKLAGEEAVLASPARAFVVRTSWLYGGRGPNFPLTALRLARERGEMRIVDDQRGGPTWARDLAAAALRLVDAGSPGVYHLANTGEATWYEVARAVVEARGLAARVEPTDTAGYPTPARRPAYSVLGQDRWLALGEPPLRPWREALRDYLAEVGDG